jgi:hypothetical protein
MLVAVVIAAVVEMVVVVVVVVSALVVVVVIMVVVVVVMVSVVVVVVTVVVVVVVVVPTVAHSFTLVFARIYSELFSRPQINDCLKMRVFYDIAPCNLFGADLCLSTPTRLYDVISQKILTFILDAVRT